MISFKHSSQAVYANSLYTSRRQAALTWKGPRPKPGDQDDAYQLMLAVLRATGTFPLLTWETPAYGVYNPTGTSDPIGGRVNYKSWARLEGVTKQTPVARGGDLPEEYLHITINTEVFYDKTGAIIKGALQCEFQFFPKELRDEDGPWTGGKIKSEHWYGESPLFPVLKKKKAPELAAWIKRTRKEMVAKYFP